MRIRDSITGRTEVFNVGDRVRYNGCDEPGKTSATISAGCCNHSAFGIIVGFATVDDEGGDRYILWRQDGEVHRVVLYDWPHLLDRI